MDVEQETGTVYSAAELRRNWLLVSAAFGVTSGGIVAFGAYASDLLKPSLSLGGDCNAAQNLFWLFSSLFIGYRVNSALGAKKCMIIGILGYDVLYLAFLLFGAQFEGEDTWVKWGIFLTAYAISGIGAGCLWTAQGDYFAQTLDKIAKAEGGKIEDLSQKSASIFAGFNLGAEVAMKLMFSGLQYMEVDKQIQFAIAFTFAIGFTAAMTRAIDFPAKPSQGKDFGKMLDIMQDPTIWLLSFMNFLFAASAGLLNTLVPVYLGQNVGSYAIGLCSALLSGVATVAQPVYSFAVDRLGKVAIMGFASGIWILFSVGYITLDLQSLGWSLASFYVMQALGRAAFESTNRAVFADFFPPPRSQEAFANVSLQQATAFTIGFFSASRASPAGYATVLIILSLCVVPGILFAHSIRRRTQTESLVEDI